MVLHPTCACGQRFRVDGRFAGRKVKCPQCGNIIVVPIALLPSGPNPGHAPPASTTTLDDEDILGWLGPAETPKTKDAVGLPLDPSMPQEAIPNLSGLNDDASYSLAPLENVEDSPFLSSSISPFGRSTPSSDSHSAKSRPRAGKLWGRIVSTNNIGRRIAAAVILLVFLTIAGNMIQRSGGIRGLLTPSASATAKKTQTERDVKVAFEALQNLGMRIEFASTGAVESENGVIVHDSRQRRAFLVLSGNQIKDDDLIHVVSYYQGVLALGNHFPEVLMLSGTSVSDAGIPHLSKLTGLRELNVENTQMSDQGVAQLREILGKHGTVIRQ